jgi:hypothetical protein
MLGFRGHFSTKTRHYSTTLGALRQARAEWRRLQVAITRGETPPPTNGPQDETTLVLAHWAYAGTGLNPTEQWLSTSLASPDTTPAEGATDRA